MPAAKGRRRLNGAPAPAKALDVLVRTARAVAAAERPEDAVRTTLYALCETLGAAGAAILRADGGRLVPVVADGMTVSERRMDETALADPGRSSYPLVLGGRVEGVLVTIDPHPNGRATGTALPALLDLAAVALRNARLEQERTAATAALAARERRFRAMLEHGHDGIALADAAGTFLYASPVIQEMMGRRPEDVQGTNIFDYVHPEDAPRRRELLAWLLANPGVSRAATYRVRHADGSWRWLDVVGTNWLHDPDVGAVVTNFRDVTEREVASAALRESEERFRAIWERASDAMALSDPDGIVLLANPAYCTLYGYSADELIGNHFSVIFPTSMRPAARDQYRDVFTSSGAPPAFESVVQRGDGTTRLVDARATFITRGDRRVAMLSLVRDITDRRRGEAARAELAAIVESSADAIIGQTLEGVITTWNHGAELVFGYTGAEAVGQRISLIIPPERAAEIDQILNRVARGEQVSFFDTVRRRKDGVLLDVSLSVSPVRDAAGDIVGASTISRDITERRRAQAEVLEINRRLRVALDDLSEREAALRTSEERLRQALTEVTARERTISDQVERLQLLNAFAQQAASALETDQETVLREAVRQAGILSGASHSTIWRREPAADQLARVATWTADQTVRRGPATVKVRAGTSLAEALRSGVPAVTDGRDSPAIGRRRTGPAGAAVALPITMGDRVWGVLEVGFSEHSGGTADRVAFLRALVGELALAIRNHRLYADLLEANARLQASLEELEQAQAQVIQRERLRALGEMASGIAHDFNNALAPVLGFSELLLEVPKNLADAAKARQYLELIHTGARDASAVVGRLREFYRQREEGEPVEPVDVGRLVTHVISLTQPRWKDQAQADGRTIRVLPELRPVPLVAGHEAELREALTNLIFNAVDALPDGGTITLAARLEPVPSAIGTSRVALSVRDTGTGMIEEVRRRCLEPFYTTKGDRGSGLGLSMVHGSVRRHGGEMTIESAPGAGTTVTLYLPLAVPDDDDDGLDAELEIRPLRVLVVDDEAGVRQVTVAFLQVDGHEAVGVSSGMEALAALETGDFDLVITDRAMPGMSGDQLAEAIRKMTPGVPVILLTGFGALMAAAECRAAAAVLAKPTSIRALRETIAAVFSPEG